MHKCSVQECEVDRNKRETAEQEIREFEMLLFKTKTIEKRFKIELNKISSF